MSTYGTRDWMSRSAVAAVFPTKEQAQGAIKELKEKNFSDSNIGFAMRERDEHGVIREEKTGTHAGTGAATGIVAGGILGAIAGLLVAAGTLMIPGVGPFIFGGVLASTFGVAGAGAVAGGVAGAVAGGILGALIGLGIPRHEAEYFEREVQAGKALVTVTAEGRADEAAYILEKRGGDTANFMYEQSPQQAAQQQQRFTVR